MFGQRLQTLSPPSYLRRMSSSALSITSTVKLNNGLDMPVFGLGCARRALPPAGF